MCNSRKYSYPPQKVFQLELPTPLEIPVSTMLSLKKCAFENPLPLGMSVNLPWGEGMNIFWNRTILTEIHYQETHDENKEKLSVYTTWEIIVLIYNQCFNTFISETSATELRKNTLFSSIWRTLICCSFGTPRPSHCQILRDFPWVWYVINNHWKKKILPAVFTMFSISLLVNILYNY